MYHIIIPYTSVYHQEMDIIMHTNLIYIMLPLNQNTICLHNLAIHFYTYLRPIDSINFPNNYYTCSYLQSTHMIVKIKLTNFVVCSNPCSYFGLMFILTH